MDMPAVMCPMKLPTDKHSAISANLFANRSDELGDQRVIGDQNSVVAAKRPKGYYLPSIATREGMHLSPFLAEGKILGFQLVVVPFGEHDIALRRSNNLRHPHAATL